MITPPKKVGNLPDIDRGPSKEASSYTQKKPFDWVHKSQWSIFFFLNLSILFCSRSSPDALEDLVKYEKIKFQNIRLYFWLLVNNV